MVSPDCACHRSAITQIELLVVIAILVTAIGLSVPAVQKVRQAAARLQCANHLKLIGLAFHCHHDHQGAFPHGGSNVPPATTAHPENRAEWSWCYQVLPFVEQADLYRASVTTIDRTPIKAFHCPTRRAAQRYNDGARVDYAGSAGTNGCDGANGMLTRPPGQPPCRMMDVTDGLASTVLVGEKQLNSLMFGYGRDDGEPCFRAGWSGDWQVYRVGSSPPAPDYQAENDDSPSPRFGSAHDSGLNVVFGDGSVRHIRYGIRATVWRRACVRDDGKTFLLSDL